MGRVRAVRGRAGWHMACLVRGGGACHSAVWRMLWRNVALHVRARVMWSCGRACHDVARCSVVWRGVARQVRARGGVAGRAVAWRYVAWHYVAAQRNAVPP